MKCTCCWVRLRHVDGNAVEEGGGTALESGNPVPHDRVAALANGGCRWRRVRDWCRGGVTLVKGTTLVEKLCLVLTLRHWLGSSAVEHPCGTGGVSCLYKGCVTLPSHKPQPPSYIFPNGHEGVGGYGGGLGKKNF
ncbi:hypothetical protein PIB30_035379 [Stylosanthes scabra]|uniref:Uncharacterized protein n=1 Tax=Stylosanthes scabra TaxID=79078 RepID=A0ABU6XC90_9FABA|nr:hypothetical protein [Stylosanthes scabra]